MIHLLPPFTGSSLGQIPARILACSITHDIVAKHMSRIPCISPRWLRQVFHSYETKSGPWTMDRLTNSSSCSNKYQMSMFPGFHKGCL